MESEHEAIHSAPPSPEPEVTAVAVPEQNTNLKPFNEVTWNRKRLIVRALLLANLLGIIIVVVLLVYYTQSEYTSDEVGLAVSLGIFVGLESTLLVFSCIKWFQYNKYSDRRPSQTIKESDQEILAPLNENPLDPTSQVSPAKHSKVKFFRRMQTNNLTNSQSSDEDSARVISVGSANQSLEVHAPNNTPSVSGPSSESGSVNTGTTSAEMENAQSDSA